VVVVRKQEGHERRSLSRGIRPRSCASVCARRAAVGRQQRRAGRAGGASEMLRGAFDSETSCSRRLQAYAPM
jgi:hypothetical protein